MYWTVSVAPVVFVMVIELPEAGTTCTGFALVVTSLPTQKKVEVDVKAGEIPVIVEVFDPSTADP
jgi:hypothetical protein